MITPEELKANYESVHAKIAAVAGTRKVELIAVSKSQPLEAVHALYKLGHRDFGENYVQEMVEKAEAMEAKGCMDVRWHFLGHLQSNKVKSLLPYVHVIHSLDSIRLGQEISKQMKNVGHTERLSVFIEVNVSGEETKSGIREAELRKLAASLSKVADLRILGLMCIPAPDRSLQAFEKLRILEEDLKPVTEGFLSMGMTQDYEMAVQQGATHVRVGTGIFGNRTS